MYDSSLSPSPLSLTLIGLGRWGQLHFQKWSTHPLCQVCQVVDINPSTLRIFDQLNPSPQRHTQITTINPSDLIVLTTPIHAFQSVIHTLELQSFLSQTRILFVEKPGGKSQKELQDLYELSQRTHIHIYIGYLERFNPCVSDHLFPHLLHWIHTACKSSPVPEIRLYTQRDTSTPASSDLGIDLISHDLDLFLCFLRQVLCVSLTIDKTTQSAPFSCRLKSASSVSSSSHIKTYSFTFELCLKPYLSSLILHLECRAQRTSTKKRMWFFGEEHVDLSLHQSDPLALQCNHLLNQFTLSDSISEHTPPVSPLSSSSVNQSRIYIPSLCTSLEALEVIQLIECAEYSSIPHQSKSVFS